MRMGTVENRLARDSGACFIMERARIWWNWQTRYFEVVVGQPVQVQVLLCAPLFLKTLGFLVLLRQP
jgi:hypothetical protein